jgi:hypothetical protein
VQPICLAAWKDDDAWRWHERFGHLHFDALHRLGKEAMALGIPDRARSAGLRHLRHHQDVPLTVPTKGRVPRRAAVGARP